MPGLFPGVEHGLIPAKSRTDVLESRARKLSGRKGGAIEKKSSFNKAFPLGEHVVRLENKDLREWPVELFTKVLLKTLVLSKNRLTVVCPGIESLRNLRRLELNGNRIASVSPEICKLHNLEHLGLENNCIEELPIETGYLVQIHTLNLEGNPLTGKACSTAVETFDDIWQQPVSLPVRGPGGMALAEKTRSILKYLQDNMSSSERAVLGDKEQRWRRRQAKQALKAAVKVADMMRLQKALNAAEATGLSLDDMSEGRVALLVLQTLRQAIDRRSSEEMMAAIASWEKVSNLGEGNCRVPGCGADLDRALELLKEIKRETLALSFRKRSGSRSNSGRKLQPIAYSGDEEQQQPQEQEPPRQEEQCSSGVKLIPSVRSSPAVSRGASAKRIVARRATPVVNDKSKAVKGGGERDQTFEMWLRSKKQMEKKKADEMKEYNRQLRQEKMQKEELERQEQERLEKLEKLWPSQADEGFIPIGLDAAEEHESNPVQVEGRSLSRRGSISEPPRDLHPVLEEAEEEQYSDDDDHHVGAAGSVDGSPRHEKHQEVTKEDFLRGPFDFKDMKPEEEDSLQDEPERYRTVDIFDGEPPISSRLMQARNMLMTEPPSPRAVDDDDI